jgi:hypothetical protein
MKKRKAYLMLLIIPVVLFGMFNAIVPFYGDDIYAKYDVFTGKYVGSLDEALVSSFHSWLYYTPRAALAFVMTCIVNFLGESMFNYNTAAKLDTRILLK